MALDDHFDASRLAGHIERPPRLPVGGVWARLIAFITDWILLKFLFYALALGVREPLLDLGRGASYLAGAIIFLYFWLGDGPLGKGRTVGKALMGLRTVSASDGRILSPGRAALRAAILLPPYLWFAAFVTPSLKLSPGSAAGIFVFSALPLVMWIALYIGQVLYVSLNPTRQGFHDEAAGSLVLGIDQLGTTWSVLEEQAGAAGMLRRRKARQAGWICMVAFVAILGFTFYRALWGPGAKENLRINADLAARVAPFGVELPTGGPKQMSVEGKPGSATSPTLGAAPGATAPGTRPTSPTLDAAKPPKEFEFHLFHIGRDSRPPEKIRADLNRLADSLIEFYRGEDARLTREAAARGKPEAWQPVPRGARFVFVYDVYLNLLLHQQAFEVLRVERKF